MTRTARIPHRHPCDTLPCLTWHSGSCTGCSDRTIYISLTYLIQYVERYLSISGRLCDFCFSMCGMASRRTGARSHLCHMLFTAISHLSRYWKGGHDACY